MLKIKPSQSKHHLIFQFEQGTFDKAEAKLNLIDVSINQNKLNYLFADTLPT